MDTIRSSFYMFLCGFFDSISIYWLRKILFTVHPITKEVHPSSFKLLETFKNAFIQVIVLFICFPAILDYLEFDLIGNILQIIFLLLSYGYLFFYNIEVMTATKEIALWSANFPNTYYCQFDVKQKFNSLYSLSNLIKNFLFLLLYYTPLNIVLNVISLFSPTIGTILIVISEGFFSAAFYFLQKWPYDRYNIAFIQKNAAYMLGYGFFVSLICNCFLSGFISIAAFFIISLWMMINCQLFSPPPIDNFQSLSEVWQCIKTHQKRAYIPNAFNVHRQKLRTDRQYRKQLKKLPMIVKPALLLTQYLNQRLGKRLQRKLLGIKVEQNRQQPILEQQKQN